MSRRAAGAVLVLALGAGGGCDDGAPAAEETAPPAAGVTTVLAATTSVEARRRVAGSWWVLAPALPVQGLYLTLEESGTGEGPDDGPWDGSWVSFDWRGTKEGGEPARASRPVEVSARRDGDVIVVSGPVPQVDALGRPTGASGHWELAVKAASLPGQPLHFTGRMVHSEGSPARDVEVEVLSTFRSWAP